MEQFFAVLHSNLSNNFNSYYLHQCFWSISALFLWNEAYFNPMMKHLIRSQIPFPSNVELGDSIKSFERIYNSIDNRLISYKRPRHICIWGYFSIAKRCSLKVIASRTTIRCIFAMIQKSLMTILSILILQFGRTSMTFFSQKVDRPNNSEKTPFF